MQAPPIASEEIRRKLSEILQRPEFQPQQESWLGKVLDWFLGWLNLELPDTGAFQIAVLFIAAVLIGALLSLAIVRLVLSRGRPGRSSAGAPLAAGADAGRRVSALLAEARAARARGELPLALRLFFFALVVGLGRAGDLEYHDAWTNRELLQRGSPGPQLARSLEELVRELDLKSFGRVPTVEGDVDRLEAMCKRMLGNGVKRALGLALLGLVLTGLAFLPLMRRGPIEGSGSAEDRGPTGRRALFLLLDELGFEARIWRQRPGVLPAGAHVLWLSDLPQPEGDREGTESDALSNAYASGLRGPRRYRDFVLRGGHMFVSVDAERLERLRDEFGFEELDSMGFEADESDPGLSAVRWIDGTRLDLQLSGGATLRPSSGAEALLAGDRGTVAVSVPVGEGGLVLFSSDDFLENDALGLHDHGEIAVRTAARFATSGRILFDEYALGRWQPASKLGLAFGPSARWFSLHLLLLALLFTWRVAWVREFPRDPEPHGQLSPLSRARAQALLMVRAKRFDILAGMLRRGMLTRVAKGLHMVLREEGDAPARGVDERDLVQVLRRADLEGELERWRPLLITREIRSADDLERLGAELEASLSPAKGLARRVRGPQARRPSVRAAAGSHASG